MEELAVGSVVDVVADPEVVAEEAVCKVKRGGEGQTRGCHCLKQGGSFCLQ
jgi:hypothetical protein